MMARNMDASSLLIIYLLEDVLTKLDIETGDFVRWGL
jgi:hypothetical protein